MTTALNVFGIKPDDAIFNPTTPYSIRLNCQAGQLALSETDFLGNSAEISIIKISRFYGSLGKAQGKEWLQIFYVPIPGCDVLPESTVCVSYIKTRSLDQFNQQITRLIGTGVNPATGVFRVSFVPHSNETGNYYSVRFDWRERKGSKETKQLDQIVYFMEDSPRLADLSATRDMHCLDGLSQEQIDGLIAKRLESGEESEVVINAN